MITYRLQIVVGNKAQALTIHANYNTITETNQVEFYDAADTLIATVPAEIIIDIEHD